MIKELKVLLGEFVTDEQLEFIQCHEMVESCSYEGLTQGHGGNYYWDIKLIDDDEIYSVYQER